MDLVVPDHVAYCFSAGRPIFMDINRNRYFAVSERVGGLFRTFVQDGRVDSPSDLELLVRKGLLARSEAAASPRRQAITVKRERPIRAKGGLDPIVAAKVAGSVWAARRELAHRPFAKIYARLVQRRNTLVDPVESQLGQLCATFQRHRAVVPIRSVCLHDSIALLDFLAREGARADLVFGVTASPFSAHCWLQRDDQVLNDHLDRVVTFTPIVVV